MRLRLRVDRRDALMWATVLVAVAIPLPGLLGYAGPPMEEGFMLVFPERLLRGDLPHVDFLHLYGPGSLWFLAGVYGIFGTSLEVERLVALAWDLGIIAGATVIGARWGRVTGAVSGVVAVVLTLTPTGLTALAWNGAVAAGLWGAIWTARQIGTADAARRVVAPGGVAMGVALLFRPDLVVAVGAALAVARWLGGPSVAGPLVRGLGLGVAPMLVHLGLSGPLRSVDGMFVDPVFRLRDGRALPRPPSWDVLDGALQKAGAIDAYVPVRPLLDAPNQVFVWFFVLPLTALAVVGIGWWSRRRRGPSGRSTLLLVSGAFAVGLLPQAMQRPDSTHLAWVGCVVLPLAVPALVEAASWRRGRVDRVGAVASVAAVPLVLALVLPSFSIYPYVDIAAQGVGRRTIAHEVRRDGRHFFLGTAAGAEAAQQLVDELESRPLRGRSLFVGTADLRRTPYSDAFFYHLFPEMTPSTRYIEMDPGIANAADSGLADDVREADYLILSHFWDVWVEPNASTEPGSAEPNAVVASDFCLIGDYDGRLELYERCR